MASVSRTAPVVEPWLRIATTKLRLSNIAYGVVYVSGSWLRLGGKEVKRLKKTSRARARRKGGREEVRARGNDGRWRSKHWMGEWRYDGKE